MVQVISLISSCMITGNSANLKGGFLLLPKPLPRQSPIARSPTTVLQMQRARKVAECICLTFPSTISQCNLLDNTAAKGSEICALSNCILRVSFSNFKGGQDSIAIDAPVSTPNFNSRADNNFSAHFNIRMV